MGMVAPVCHTCISCRRFVMYHCTNVSNVYIHCCSQVNFFIEPTKDPTASDLCLPAWAARTVTRADQAYFVQKSCVFPLVMSVDAAQDASSATLAASIQLKHLEGDTVAESQHLLVRLQVQVLEPHPDAETMIAEERTKQQAQVEKTIRNWIATSEKAAAKAKNKKGRKAKERQQTPKDEGDAAASAQADATQAGQAVELLRNMGMDVPETQEQQVEAIKKMIEREDKLEELVTKARHAVPKMTGMPITRLPGEDDRANRSSRSKLMHAALEQAQMTTGQSKSTASDGPITIFGPLAAVDDAQTRGIVKPSTKKKTAKNDMANQVVSLGRHMLK